MRTWAVFNKEMRLYFGSPVAYAFLALFLIISGWMFSQIFLIYSEMSMRAFMQPMGPQSLNPTENVMRPLFSNMSVVLLFFIPYIVVPACLGCHGGSRRNSIYPIIDGQHAEYLKTQLRLFAAGQRGGTRYARHR